MPNFAAMGRTVVEFYCCYVSWLCDLDLWLFDLGQWSYMANHVVNPLTKFENSMPIVSWDMSYDVCHMLPLSLTFDSAFAQPMRMLCNAIITWPMSRGQYFPYVWKSWARFMYSLCNVLGSTINVKRLSEIILSCPVLNDMIRHGKLTCA